MTPAPVPRSGAATLLGRVHGFTRRLVSTLGMAKGDHELADELESHLQLHVDDNVRTGMHPDEARRQAVLALGGVDQTKERHRDQRGLPFIEHLAQDLRFTLRGLARNPGFTAVAVLTLAVGVGANVTVFSLANALLFKPLDIADPELAVHVFSGRSSNTPYEDYLTYRDGNSTLSGLGAFSFISLSLRGPAASELVQGALVSGNWANLATPIEPMALVLAFAWRVMSFSLGASCATTVIFGLLPAMQASRTSLQTELKDGGYTAASSRSRTRGTV